MVVKDDLQKLFFEFLPDLLIVSNNITKEMEAAEDICQESFIKLYNRPIPFLKKEDVKFWLIRVVKNASLNYYRKKKNEAKAIERWTKEKREYVPAADVELIHKSTVEAVRKAIDSLPDAYKEVVVLKEYKDYSYKEIAKILKITEANVKVRLFRAREMLYNILYEEYYNERSK